MKQESLFELINSMNKSEKRYFKLQSSLQAGEKIYLDLFNALEKADSFIEKDFREQHSNEKFVKNFAFHKNHLYRLIIKSLVSYNSGSSVDTKIMMLIAECRILFSKALFQRYFRAIQKAKALAIKYERFGYLLQIIDMEKIIVRKEELNKAGIDSRHKEVQETIAKIKNSFEYSRLAGLLLENYRQYGLTRGEAQKSLLDDIIKDKIMQNPSMALSSKAKESYYRVKELYAAVRADHNEVFDALRSRYSIVTRNPAPFNDLIIHYSSDILYSLMETSLRINKPDEAAGYLKAITELKITSKDAACDIEIFSEFVPFRINILKGEFTKAGRMIPKLEGLLKKFRNKMLIDTELSIMYYIIKCRISEEKFAEALKASNNLSSHPFLFKRADYESYLKILYLIIHFELKNYDLLKYIIISTYRFLYKKEKLFKVELLVLQFIRGLPKVKSEHDLQFIFTRMAKQLQKLKTDKFERNAFEYFDFAGWVNKKIAAK
jgi:hypothetical protein